MAIGMLGGVFQAGAQGTMGQAGQVQAPKFDNGMGAVDRRVNALQSENPMDTLLKAKEALGMLHQNGTVNKEDHEHYSGVLDQAIEANGQMSPGATSGFANTPDLTE